MTAARAAPPPPPPGPGRRAAVPGAARRGPRLRLGCGCGLGVGGAGAAGLRRRASPRSIGLLGRRRAGRSTSRPRWWSATTSTRAGEAVRRRVRPALRRRRSDARRRAEFTGRVDRPSRRSTSYDVGEVEHRSTTSRVPVDVTYADGGTDAAAVRAGAGQRTGELEVCGVDG